MSSFPQLFMESLCPLQTRFSEGTGAFAYSFMLAAAKLQSLRCAVFTSYPLY